MNKEDMKLPEDRLEEVSGGLKTSERRPEIVNGGLKSGQTVRYFCPTCKHLFTEKKISGGTDVVPMSEYCPNCKVYVFPSHEVL